MLELVFVGFKMASVALIGVTFLFNIIVTSLNVAQKDVEAKVFMTKISKVVWVMRMGDSFSPESIKRHQLSTK